MALPTKYPGMKGKTSQVNEYVLLSNSAIPAQRESNGYKLTTDRRAAYFAKDDAIRGLWTAISPIPWQYPVATALHEGAINEVDTEPTKDDGSNYVSYGAFQLGDDERKRAGIPDGDLLDLYDAVQVFAKLSEARLHELADAAALPLAADLSDIASLPKDIWAYLALAHNEGDKAAIDTIKAHGLDWQAYKKRNPTSRLVKSGYGDDVISGKGRGDGVSTPQGNKPERML